MAGDTAQGGTAAMTSGDTLMRYIVVYHGSCANYLPFTLQNTNANPVQSPLTYNLVLDSAGFATTQYSFVTPTSGAIPPGGSVTPVLQFCPSSIAFGVQEARLRVTTSDGDSRVYTLRAQAGAPQIEFTINGSEVNSGTPLFNQVVTCVGTEAYSLPLTLRNIGIGDVTVNDLDIYEVDSTYQQGTPLMPLRRDSRMRLIPASEYVLSLTPGQAPITANPQPAFPITLGNGAEQTYYLTFVGSRPGRRFVRAFFRTTGENFIGTDTTFYNNTSIMPTRVLGLMTFDLIANSFGATLAADSTGLRLTPLVFPSVRVGESAVASFQVANSGACDLRIDAQQLRIYSGDVNEFKIESAFANRSRDAEGDFVLRRFEKDTITIRFTPSRSGTRMATLRFVTNDSTVIIPGVTERGVMLLDIQGRGQAGLDPRDLVLAPVVVGSSSHGVAKLENSSTATVDITYIGFEGDDAAEFFPGSAPAWPAIPARVAPGSTLELGVTLTPTGAAGGRRTRLIVVSATNDTFRVNIRGEAGTTQLIVSPTSLFEDVTIPVGSTVIRTVKIANDGNFPLRIQRPVLTGPDAANYQLADMNTLEIAGGWSEELRVTFAPSTQGQSSAQIEITPVGGGAPQIVTLGGTALRIRKDVDPNSQRIGTINPEKEIQAGSSNSDDDVSTTRTGTSSIR
jgi:hypothetical protein